MSVKSSLFQRKITCPACGYKYKTTAVLSSKIRRKKTHSDFYVEYENINPNYYLVKVCPTCGYAFFKDAVPLKKNQKEVVFEKISAQWNPRDFSQQRDLSTAITTYKLAFLCGQAINEKNNIMAAILMHLVWLYREAEDNDNEMRFILLARNYYQKIYEGSDENVDVARTLYLLGQLSFRLGEHQQALKWYRIVIDDKRIQDATIIRLAREQYAEVRYIQKN